MVYDGIVPASPLTIAPCGLFSVAQVVDHPGNDEHWIAGAYVETDAFPTVNLRNNQDQVITGGAGVIYDGTGKANSYQTTPFFIELKARATSIDFARQGGDLSPTMIKQVKAVSQKAVERELWEGVAAQAATPATQASFLRRPTGSGGASVKTSGGVAPEKALFLLEQAISESPTGGRGVIHVTRDVASALGNRLHYFDTNEIDDKTYAVTRIGTPVVVGSGYTGNGPVGTTGATASATNRWMFLTGGVVVEMGDPDVVQVSIAEVNEHIAHISLAAAVHFDPSLFAAAQVTLP